MHLRLFGHVSNVYRVSNFSRSGAFAGANHPDRTGGFVGLGRFTHALRGFVVALGGGSLRRRRGPPLVVVVGDDIRIVGRHRGGAGRCAVAIGISRRRGVIPRTIGAIATTTTTATTTTAATTLGWSAVGVQQSGVGVLLFAKCGGCGFEIAFRSGARLLAFTRLARRPRFTRRTRFAGFTGNAWLSGFSGFATFTRGACFTRLPRLPGLSGFATFGGCPRLAWFSTFTGRAGFTRRARRATTVAAIGTVALGPGAVFALEAGRIGAAGATALAVAATAFTAAFTFGATRTASSATVTRATLAIARAAPGFATARPGRLCRRRRGSRSRCRRTAEPAEEFLEQAGCSNRCGNHRWYHGCFDVEWCWLLRGDAAYGGFRAARFLGGRGWGQVLHGRIHHGVAGGHGVALVELVVLEAGDGVVGRFEVQVGDEHHGDLEAGLDGVELAALLVEQVGGDFDRDLGMHGRGVFLHGLLLHDPQDVKR